DRDEIMDYVFKRYGKQQVALLGSYPTFKRDSTIRELGKVFGLNDEEIKTLQSDRHQPDQQQPNPQLSNQQRPGQQPFNQQRSNQQRPDQQRSNQPHHQPNQQHQQPNHQPNPRYLNPHQPNQQRNQQQPNSHPSDQIGRLIVQYGRLLQGFPQNPSLHPCGMLISEKPLAEYVSLFMPPKGFPTAMMDMFVAEDISMNKFDILSQRGLGHIREALRLIRSNRQTTIDIHEVSRFMEDEKIAGQIREANTIGCFYI